MSQMFVFKKSKIKVIMPAFSQGHQKGIGRPVFPLPYSRIFL